VRAPERPHITQLGRVDVDPDLQVRRVSSWRDWRRFAPFSGGVLVIVAHHQEQLAISGDVVTDRRSTSTFGFVSVGAVMTRGIGASLNLHGGVEYEHLGPTTKAFNGGEASKTIASVGVGFSR
jgi:hypothetical protein